MRYLVAGGAGFIGSNFVSSALANPEKFNLESITVLDNLTYSGNLRNLEPHQSNPLYSFLKGDITNRKVLDQLVSQVDVVINFAAESHVDRSIDDPTIFFDTNIIGVSRILEAIRKYPHVRFVQISTDEVYGSLSEGSATENSPLRPNSPYAASKASADLLIRSYVETFGLDIITTRCTNNYGPFQFPEKLIPFFISRIAYGLTVPIYGSGLNVRDWIHVEDHIEGIRLAILSGKKGDIYNLGGANELTNLEITRSLLKLLGKDESLIKFVDDRLGHDFRYSLNFDYANQVLGFAPQIDFSTGLESTVSWYLANRAWWEPLVKRNIHE